MDPPGTITALLSLSSPAIQGIAFKDQDLIVTYTSRLVRYGNNLAPISINSQPFASYCPECDHLGASAIDGNLIYTVGERTRGHALGHIAAFDASSLTMTRVVYVNALGLRANGGVAVDSSRRELYAFGFYDPRETTQERVLYVFSLPGLALVRRITLSTPIQGLQGGAVIGRRLYLTSWDGMKSRLFEVALGSGDVRLIGTLAVSGEVEGITPDPLTTTALLVAATDGRSSTIYRYRL